MNSNIHLQEDTEGPQALYSRKSLRYPKASQAEKDSDRTVENLPQSGQEHEQGIFPSTLQEFKSFRISSKTRESTLVQRQDPGLELKKSISQDQDGANRRIYSQQFIDSKLDEIAHSTANIDIDSSILYVISKSKAVR